MPCGSTSASPAPTPNAVPGDPRLWAASLLALTQREELEAAVAGSPYGFSLSDYAGGEMSIFRPNACRPKRGEGLPGCEAKMRVPDPPGVLGTPLKPPFPDGVEQAQFGLGCFWGAERKFWEVPG